GYDGVHLDEGASSNWIGVNPNGDGVVGDEGNVISGNGFDGIQILGGSDENVVAGNKIGTDASGSVALANASDGVGIQGGASDNTVGGITAAAGNLIEGNGGNGVTVGYSPSDLCLGNAITGNRIHGNHGQAIDLGADGVTDNASSPRQGPNNLQNFPIIVTT